MLGLAGKENHKNDTGLHYQQKVLGKRLNKLSLPLFNFYVTVHVKTNYMTTIALSGTSSDSLSSVKLVQVVSLCVCVCVCVIGIPVYHCKS